MTPTARTPDIPDSPERSAYLALVQLHDRLASEFAQLFREHGLSPAWFNVLRILVQGPREGVRCREIGERLIHREPDVTRLLDRMEAAGLVTRARSDADRRVVLTRVTAKGRKACESLYVPVATLHAHQFDGVPKKTVRELDRALRAALAAG